MKQTRQWMLAAILLTAVASPLLGQTVEDTVYVFKSDQSDAESVHEIARYNMQGQRIATPAKGINIIKMSDGTTKKAFVK